MIVISDSRFRDQSIPIDELQAEVQDLLERDMRDTSGQAHVTISMLRRHPETPENLALQVAILEGEVVRRQTILDITSLVLVGQLYFNLLGKWATKS